MPNTKNYRSLPIGSDERQAAAVLEGETPGGGIKCPSRYAKTITRLY